MKNRQAQQCVLIVAGEASGDLHGANLVRAIQARRENLFFCGIGGGLMRDAGVRILADVGELSVVGATEIASKLPNLIRVLAMVKRLLRSLRPDLLILIDFPGFNLHVAPLAKKLGIPILYYISPQVWAWRSGRVKQIRKLVDHMAVILPFEKDFYGRHGIRVTFVGHPLLDNRSRSADGDSPRAGGDPAIIGLLPGSRDKEVGRHLPLLLGAARILSRQIEGLKFLVSLAPTLKRSYLEKLMAEHKGETDCELVDGGAEKVFEQCGFALAASGTVSLEAAVWGVPMLIIYKVSPVSYWLGRILVQVEHIGLVNLIAGEEVVPELIQAQATPKNIAAGAAALLKDPARLEQMRKRLLETRKALGGPGASERTAAIAVGML